jgi:maltose/moltooligosaccharide transporter
MYKIELPFKKLLLLAIAAFGIQFATALQMSNMTSLYKFLGAKSINLPFLWLAAPISGLLIQPLVGQLSDSTVTQFGKRKPFLLFWGLLSAFALMLMPLVHAVWIAAIFLWLLECSINGSTESLRALTADLTPPSQRAKAFAIQTLFAGIGSGIAATLPWLIHHFINSNSQVNLIYYLPQPLKLSFLVGSIVIIFTVIWTLLNIKEKPFTKTRLYNLLKTKNSENIFNNIKMLIKEIHINIKNIPPVIKNFYTIQIFTWVGLFCFWLYLGLAISQHFFGLPPGIIVTENHQYADLLESGTEWAGICYGTYQFVSVIYSILLIFISTKISLRLIHGFSLIAGGVGITSIFFIHDPLYVLISMLGVGMMWGSIMSMPYAIISRELPIAKMGVYLGLFNITITVPQIICGLLLGPVMTYIFHNRAPEILSLGGIFIFIAGILMLKQYQSKKTNEFTLAIEND